MEIRKSRLLDHRKSKRILEKHLLYAKAFDYVDNNSLWKKILKRWEYQTTLPVSWEICMQVKKQQNQTRNNEWTGSK